MWNDGSNFEHHLTDPWAPHPVVNPKTVCFKGGGGGGNDASFYQNIANDQLLQERNHERDLETQEAGKRAQEAQAARDAEAARQAKISGYETDINSRFDSMFNPSFYSGREQAYRDYYQPQLDKQYTKSGKDLTYWLADRGLLDSSVRGDKDKELTDLYDSGVRQINNGALDMTAQTKNSIANARSGLISDARNANPIDEPTLSSTMTALAPPTTSYQAPVYGASSTDNFANMFGTFTGALSQQAALERASALSGGAIRPTFNTGLFAPSSNSVSVIS